MMKGGEEEHLKVGKGNGENRRKKFSSFE